ncbi:MAG: hypothetical protein PHV20_11805 [Bacteroidales bacterium]|nr:hypothetical protein [Bacteroidales bacterium]
MNLKYSILWFENDVDWYESIVDNIREIVEDELGFKMNLPLLKKDGDDLENVNFSNYDLILMDLNLDKSPTGDKLIQRIRGFEVFTNIIFYSSEGVSKVSEKIKELELEGVYFSGRDGNSFVKKVEKIIYSTIRKVQDINNMRGLVMAEVSELDHKMIDLLKQYLSNLETDEKNRFIDKRKKKVLKSLNDMIGTFSNLSDDSIFEHRDFSTNHKWMSVQNIANHIGDKEIIELLNNYKSDIIDKRNKLAHVKEVVLEDGSLSLADGDFVFNDEICKIIRKDLQRHTVNFEKIKIVLTH